MTHEVQLWQRSYERVHNGRMITVPDARAWKAEDYDLIEKLIMHRLPVTEIRRYFTPMPTTTAMRCAMTRAGFTSGARRGRPTKADRTHWASVHRLWREGKL